MYFDNLKSADTRELMAAAFETLLFFPGIDFERWKLVLLREYTEEVVAALGTDPEDVTEALDELWHNTDYRDESTDITKKYCDWAALLSNKSMVDYYYKLVAEANAARDKGRH